MTRAIFATLALLLLLTAACDPGGEPDDGSSPVETSTVEDNHFTRERYAAVIDGPVNLRREPSLDAPILRQLSTRTRLEVLAEGQLDVYEGTSAPWYEVRTAEGERGFVFGAYLDLEVGTPAAGLNPRPPLAELPDPDPELTAGMGTAALLEASRHSRAEGFLEESVNYLLAALQLSPENTEAYFTLSELYAVKERWDYAAAALERYVEQEPVSFWGHNNLGLYCLRYGDYPRAIAVLERAVQLEPEGRNGAARDQAIALAYRNLIAAYSANGDEEGARRVRERLAEQSG